MSKISDLPALERPREKAFRYGLGSLSNIELLALIIASGSKEYSAIDIAYDLLNDHGGISALGSLPYQEFMNYKGIGKVTALTLATIFEIAKRYQISLCEMRENNIDTQYIYEKYRPMLEEETQEQIILIILSKKRHIIKETKMYKGTDENVMFSIKDILKYIVLNNGYYFYIIHNHPNGGLTPSDQDTFFTDELIRESKHYRFKILDHLIIGKNGYYSFLNHRIVGNKKVIKKM